MFTVNRFKVLTGEIIIHSFMSSCHREDKVGMLFCVSLLWMMSLLFRFAALNPIKHGENVGLRLCLAVAVDMV